MPDNGAQCPPNDAEGKPAMPIRFRCAYCNQLMGIATRKAGSVIRCPKCAGEIIVPTPDEMPDTPSRGMDNPVNLTFEDQALDRLLQPSAAPEPPPTEQAGKPGDYLLPDRSFGPQALDGLFLSRRALVLTMIVVVVLLLLSFGIGLLIGLLVGGQHAA